MPADVGKVLHEPHSRVAVFTNVSSASMVKGKGILQAFSVDVGFSNWGSISLALPKAEG